MVTTQTRIIRLFATAAFGAAALAASPAYAGTANANLSVTANVSADCSVSTTAVAFGEVAVISSVADDATGTFSVTCTTGTAWSAAADKGLGTGATLTDRKMANGANLLSYDLYTSSGYSTIWGDAVDATTAKISGTGNGSAQSNTIYGRVPTGQGSVALGSYSDTVSVTVTY